MNNAAARLYLIHADILVVFFTDYKIIMKNILKKPKAYTQDLVSPLNLEKFPGEKQYVVED